MGWKGTMRSVGSAVRAAERASAKAAKQRQQAATEAESEQVVQNFERFLETATGMHRGCSDPIDWIDIAAQEAPEEPKPTDERTQEAQHRLDTYSPGFFARTLGLEKRQRRSLKAAVSRAEGEDAAAHRSALTQHEKAVEQRELAQSLVNGDPEAYEAVIAKYGERFQQAGPFGRSLNFGLEDDGSLTIELAANGIDQFPEEEYKVLKSGKLSVKSMPKTRRYAYHRDHVCSAALRMAREAFALLPADVVRVHATLLQVNPATGHEEEQTVLSVLIPRSTLDRLNLQEVSPSAALENFPHEERFLKTKGFQPVDRLPVGNAEDS